MNKLSEDRRFAASEIGLIDWADQQVRKAGASIITNESEDAVNQAIANYGSY